MRRRRRGSVGVEDRICRKAGVTAARKLGRSIGPFAFVLSSDVPRSLETALAMGFAVDDCVDMGGPHFDETSRVIPPHQWWETPDAFALWKEHVARRAVRSRPSRVTKKHSGEARSNPRQRAAQPWSYRMAG